MGRVGRGGLPGDPLLAIEPVEAVRTELAELRCPGLLWRDKLPARSAAGRWLERRIWHGPEVYAG